VGSEMCITHSGSPSETRHPKWAGGLYEAGAAPAS
jgi:hypothetical protein